MPRLSRFEHRFVDSFPKPLEAGVLYVSMRFRTVAHLCACGCGNKVVTPLSPAGWSMRFDGESVTLAPSVGNGRIPCRSHYFIEKNQVVWSYAMTDDLTAESQERDAAARARYYGIQRGANIVPRTATTPRLAQPEATSLPTPAPQPGRLTLRARMRAWLR